MRLAVDLHIHSALSPCADNEMTPNNIVNMALLKGLDIIAVTDHNSADNVAAVSKCAQGKNLLVVPGMEVETREEVHLLCLFPDTGAALKMQDIVYRALPRLDNREDIFGQQIIMDEHDNITGYIRQLLLTASDLSVDDIFRITGELKGVVIPAHADRDAYSILSNLGMIPENLGIRCLEITRSSNRDMLLKKYPYLGCYSYITSSDAHMLGHLLERENFIDLEQPDAESLIEVLKSGKIT